MSTRSTVLAGAVAALLTVGSPGTAEAHTRLDFRWDRRGEGVRPGWLWVATGTVMGLADTLIGSLIMLWPTTEAKIIGAPLLSDSALRFQPAPSGE